MDANERRIAFRQIAHAQHHRLFGAVAEVAAKPEDPEKPEFGRKVSFGYFLEPKRRGIVHAWLWEP